MDNEMIEKLKDQHVTSYKKSILENIKNNTNALIDEDIMALLRKPPLDSMDAIRVKFLDIAKKNSLILETEILDKNLEKYRKNVIKCCSLIKKIRNDILNEIVESFESVDVKDVIKINKKDFTPINKQIKKIIKERLSTSFEKIILKNIDKNFIDKIDSERKEKFISEISKFNKDIYQKQLISNLDIKILVRDTTLINSTKEQSERYLFTIKNSRLLKDEIKK